MGKHKGKLIEKTNKLRIEGNDVRMGIIVELYNDHFQNYKRYSIPKAQLVIADIPYNLGVNAYASETGAQGNTG